MSTPIRPFAVLSWILLIMNVYGVRAQSELFPHAVSNYLTESTKLSGYESIDVNWSMDGKLQVLLNEGINNIFDGHPSVAETNLSDLVQKDSMIWEAYYYRAISYKQMGNLKAARKDLNRVIRNGHALYESYLELGKVDQLGDDLRQAEKNFEKAIRANAEHPTAYYLRGNIQMEQNQLKSAARYYNSCLEKDSLYSDANLKLSILEIIQSNKIEAGIPYFSKVLRRDTLNRTALLFRSIATFNQSRQTSLDDLNLLVRLSPGNSMALFLRGMQFAELENYARAFPDFHKVIEMTAESDNNFQGQQTWLDKRIDIQNAGAYAVSRVYGLPDEDALKIKQAYCLLVIGAHDKCIATIKATSISEREPLCLFLSGVASEHAGKHGEAFVYYDKALKIDNDILDAHKKRGIYEQELKEWKKSISDFSEVLRINPETFVVYKMRGVSYYYEKQYSMAIEDYSRYLERDSLNKEIIGYRGVAYQTMGMPLEAAIDFVNSGNTEMLNFKALSKSIDSLLLHADTLSALSYLNTLTAQVPQFTEGFVLRIRLLLEKKDWNRINDLIDTAIQNKRGDVSAVDHSFLLTIKGMTLCKGQKYDGALTTLAQAITYDKHNSLAFLERGKLLLATGKTNKAIADLQMAASLGHHEADELLSAIHR